ncbi:ABC transporter family protein [Sphingomonas sp. RIT328]|nr:ABC transporter family protein [Sphingomonas sp. RIT328]
MAFAILARVCPALYRAITAAPPAVALALVASPAAALALALTVAATVAAGSAFGRRGEAGGRAVQQLQGALRDLLTVQLAAAAELRCYGMEAASLAHFAELDARLAAVRRQQAVAAGAIEALGALATGVAAVAVALTALPAGVPLVALGALAAVMTIDGILPVLRASAARGAEREAEARLTALFVGRTDARDTPRSVDLTLPGLRPIAPAGARIAIVGASGSGKTSLVEAMLGLREGRDRGVRLGGRPIADLPAATLRASFG